MKNINTEHWGTVPYREAWERQEKLFQEVIDAKRNNRDYVNRLIFVEHPHVYTLGRSGKADNMLLNEGQLKKIGAEFVKINRGGDITYHGPGQIVCYPILNLEDYQLHLRDYIHLIEEAVINSCAHYGIKAGRVEGATGVWIAIGTPGERKICAIGVRASRYVTMHGLAFNINTDLKYFSYINPCGFVDKGVTSIEMELGHKVDYDKAVGILEEELRKLLLK